MDIVLRQTRARKLREYTRICTELELLEEEKYRLRDGIVSSSVIACSGRRSGYTDPTAAAVVRISVIQGVIDTKLDELIRLRQEVESVISPLPTETRCLLRLRYIDGLNWAEISKRMHYSPQWLHVLHKRAMAGL